MIRGCIWMSEKLLEVTEKMILRGHILKICEIAQPIGVTQEILYGALRKEGYSCSPEDVRKACDYLQGKGLIEQEEIRNDVLQIHRIVAKITPQGVDVLEGTTAADGIQL